MSKKLFGALLALALAVAGFVSLLYPVVNPDSLAEVALEIDRAEGKVRLDSRIVIEVRGNVSKNEALESLKIQPPVTIGEDDLVVEHISKYPWFKGLPWTKTKVTINPQGARLFDPETSYRLVLQGNGLVFETITLPRVVDARIESVSHTGFSNVPTTSPIVLVFNDEVIWQQEYLAVEPSAEVRTISVNSSGRGTEVWVYPERRWENSTVYTLTLKEGILDIFGHVGTEEFSLVFATRAQPRTVEATPFGNDIAPDSAVRVAFERPVNRRTVEEAFMVQPATSGSFKWLSDTVLEWEPSEFQYSTTYTVSVGGETRDGDRIAATEWSFAIRSQPTIVEAQPVGMSLPLGSAVRIEFEREVDRSSVEEAFQIEPAVAGTFNWDNDLAVTWTPSGLEYSTTYTVSAAGESTDGDPIIPHEWSFSTHDPPVIVEIEGGDQSPTLLRAVPSDGTGEFSYQWTTGATSQKVSVDLWFNEVRTIEVTVTSGDQTATAELLVFGPPSPCPDGWKVVTEEVCYTEEVLPGPVRVFLVRMDIQDPDLQLHAAPAADYVGRLSTVSESAQARNTLVSINANFFGQKEDGYFALGPIVSGGNFIYYPQPWGVIFALDRDLQPWVGQGEEFNIYLEPPSGELRRLQTINSTPVENSLALFNSYWGKELSLDENGCYGLFAPTDEAASTAYQFSCGATENIPLKTGEFVLVGSGAAAEWMKENIQHPLTLTTSLAAQSLQFMVGGSDILIQDGEANRSISDSNVRQPRSAIGIDEEGFVYFVVADGRSTASVGMSLAELQRYLSQLGLVDAINLDGGGSSTLVVQESVMNTPSDGWERPIAGVIEVTSGDTSCWHQLIRC